MPGNNPDVSQILNTGAIPADGPNRIGKFLLNVFTKIARPLVLCALRVRLNEAAQKLESNQTRRYIGGPKTVEDEEDLKEMTVCRHLFLSMVSPVLRQLGVFRSSFR